MHTNQRYMFFNSYPPKYSEMLVGNRLVFERWCNDPGLKSYHIDCKSKKNEKQNTHNQIYTERETLPIKEINNNITIGVSKFST